MTLAAEQLGMSTQERPIDLRAEFSSFQEAAACGTAAVLSPIGKIWFDGQWHELGDAGSNVGPTMQKVYDLLVGIQRGELEDKHGWCHEVSI
jgi:branched-chain amino acid aminotransferase